MEDVTKQSSPVEQMDQQPDTNTVIKSNRVQHDLGLKHLLRFDIGQANTVALKAIADLEDKYINKEEVPGFSCRVDVPWSQFMEELFRDTEILKWTIKAFIMLKMQKFIINEASCILDVMSAIIATQAAGDRLCLHIRTL